MGSNKKKRRIYRLLKVKFMLEVILNRWRGTGTIFSISKFQVIGNMLYAMYILILTYTTTYFLDIKLPFDNINMSLIDIPNIVYNTQLLSSSIITLLSVTLYIAGESFAWGKWEGWLTDWEQLAVKDYNNKDGRSFPYIHYISNSIIKQENNYTAYCILALMIRGVVWWTPIMLLLGYTGLIDSTLSYINSLVLAVGFPISCYIGNMIHINFKSKYLNMSRGWENAELVYGFIQGLCLTGSILITQLVLKG